MRLRRAYLALHRRTNAELRRRFGVTADQFVVLNLLAERESSSQQDLCRRCGSDPSTLGALVRLLENRGLVRRAADPADGRARQVRLTRAGRTLQGELAAAAEASFHRDLWRAPRSEADAKALAQSLDRIAAAMGDAIENRS